MLYGVDSFKSLSRVKYVQPPEAYPFLCVFKEATEEESDPESIMGIFVDFGGEDRYVVCVSPDGETLVFNINHECPDIEKERAGIKPRKSEVDKESGEITEEFDRAWSCSCNENPPDRLLSKIESTLGKML
jgi:hypothetical protein